MGSHIASRRLPVDDYSVSDASRQLVDEEQQELTDLAFRRATKLIAEHRPILDDIANELLANEVLERDDIERIMAKHAATLPAPALARGGEVRIAASERLDPGSPASQ
jgi:cell division protease FtsH